MAAGRFSSELITSIFFVNDVSRGKLCMYVHMHILFASGWCFMLYGIL
jgi:hypothetical protein